jgi:prophage tail gpP-like protein
MPERVAITLASGESYGRWSEIEIARGLDCYTAVSLSGPFDHQREEVRRAFQPLAFPAVTVSIGDELVLTGYVKDVSPSVDAGQSSVGVTAYSLAHELTEICPAPALLPLEFNGMDLRQIASKLVTASIGVESIFEGQPGAVFARVRAEPDSPIHSFLVDLALQRSFVLADTPSGGALFRAEARPGAPVARLEGQPVTKVTPSFNPSSWYSSVTGRASRKAGKKGARYSELNPLYRAGHPRHYTMRIGDTESADVPRTARAAIGRMVASVVGYTIDDLPTWRDPSGELWAPNTTVTLLAPEAMIYRETELLIRSVVLRQNPEAETASLGLVLPGTFGGDLPEALPWDF